MSTYTLPALIYTGEFNNFGEVLEENEIKLTFGENTTDWSYTNDPVLTSDNGFALANVSHGAWHIRLDGTIDLGLQASGTNDTVEILQFDWMDGGTARTTYAMNIYISNQDIYALVAIGGDDFPATIATNFKDFYLSATISSPKSGSGFEPGDTISIASAPAFSSTENDEILGTGQGDDIEGGAGEDTIDGAGGDDTLGGGSDNDVIHGGDGNDGVYGGFEDDTLFGGEGNDVVYGGAGTNLVYGGADDDHVGSVEDGEIYAGSGNDALYGGFGNGTQTLFGEDGNDIFLLNTANGTAYGGAGNDSYDLGAGDVTIYGGADYDSIRTFAATSAVSIYIEYTGQDIGGDLGFLFIEGIERIDGSDFDDRFVGDRAGSDGITLFGWDGNDILKGGGGENRISGGSGDDKLRGLNENDALFGGLGNDQMIGLTGSDVMYGGDGDDYAYGGRSKDTIYGGDGNDSLRGNRGDDRIEGGNDDDDIKGGGGDDTGYGGAGHDEISGENGNDRLYGDADSDTLLGGDGSDYLYGGDDDDFLFGNKENDALYTGDGNDFADGGRGDDFIEGQRGDNTLVGGSGLDRIRAGVGNDIMTGGTQGGTGDGSEDRFEFQSSLGDLGANTITDFEVGSDEIRLTGFGTDFTADVYDNAADTADGVLITLTAGSQILIEDVLKADLDASDFFLA